MTNTIKHIDDSAVLNAVEDAARDACEALDCYFPGSDATGISSNFQGHLVRVLLQMLKGQSVLDQVQGHTTALRRLIIDDHFFGNPAGEGNAFLVTKTRIVKPFDVDHELPQLALSLDSDRWLPISHVGDCWTTFKDAVAHALRFCQDNQVSLDEAVAMGINVQAVKALDAERGYEIAG